MARLMGSRYRKRQPLPASASDELRCAPEILEVCPDDVDVDRDAIWCVWPEEPLLPSGAGWMSRGMIIEHYERAGGEAIVGPI